MNVSFDEDNDEHAPCTVEAEELVCRGVFGYYVLGDRSVTAVVSGVRSDARIVSRGRLLEPGGVPHFRVGAASRTCSMVIRCRCGWMDRTGPL